MVTINLKKALTVFTLFLLVTSLVSISYELKALMFMKLWNHFSFPALLLSLLWGWLDID